MAGIKDVAHMAGVSTATASRALTGSGTVAAATRARVQDAARVLGYVPHAPAASLASGRTGTVGVVVPDVNRWFFAAALEGIAHELMEGGLDLTLFNAGVSPGHRGTIFSELVHRGRLDALVTVSFKLNGFELAGLARLARPVVALGGLVDPGVELPDWFTALQVDDVAVATLAARHLLELGHRDIAFLGTVPEDVEFQVSTERTRGFERTMARAGVLVPPHRMVEADFTLGGACHRVRALLEGPGPRPTAILAISDEMAMGAWMAALSLGLRVPEDLSVIGVDGHPDAARLGLTTVDQTPREQGRRAARLVAETLRGTPEPRRILHRLHLRRRASTAPPP